MSEEKKKKARTGATPMTGGERRERKKGGNGPIRSENIQESRGAHTQIIGSGVPR